MIHRKMEFTLIPKPIMHDKSLTANAKLFYGDLFSGNFVSNRNEEDYYELSTKQVAEILEVTETTISNWLKNLVECGYIEIRKEIIKNNSTKKIKKYNYIRIL